SILDIAEVSDSNSDLLGIRRSLPAAGQPQYRHGLHGQVWGQQPIFHLEQR
ncbi:unnamed protein product, partial [Candidula unifasciata]